MSQEAPPQNLNTGHNTGYRKTTATVINTIRAKCTSKNTEGTLASGSSLEYLRPLQLI